MSGVRLPTTAAVVLAAGSGQRFGRPKQFELIDGVTLVDRVAATAASVCDHVVVVLPTDHQPSVDCATGAWVNAVRGGGSHGESAWIGLNSVPDSVDIVVLASASHPLAGPDLFRRTIAAVAAGADGAAPMAPLADAVKRHAEGRIVESVPKIDLALAQSPCAFNRKLLIRAYDELRSSGEPAPPEELEMIERLGGSMVFVEGEPTNIHVTTPLELEMARRLVDLVPTNVTVPGT